MLISHIIWKIQDYFKERAKFYGNILFILYPDIWECSSSLVSPAASSTPLPRASAESPKQLELLKSRGRNVVKEGKEITLDFTMAGLCVEWFWFASLRFHQFGDFLHQTWPGSVTDGSANTAISVYL